MKNFEFKQSIKIILYVLMAIGVLALAYGIISKDINVQRLWANILLNNFYTLALALASIVFVAVHVLGEAGWQTSIQRVPEAIGAYIPVAAILMLIFILGTKDIYHWRHTEHLDAILEGKKAYLNLPFFIIRMVVYLAGWIWLSRKLRYLSLLSDANSDLKIFYKTRMFAGIFIVFFAVTSSTSAWDWIMSIDAHWYSTLFGWYIFISSFVSGIAVITLLVIFLHKKGYLPHLNEEHLHDLGKYMFGFSIFWAYLWFSQFMLIWYSNIPEETTYFVQRLENYKVLFFTNLIINFAAPFLVLMTRGSKRRIPIMVAAAIIIFIGHWLDLYLAIMPGAVGHEASGIGIYEVGLTIGYLGLFLYVAFNALTKAPLVPENHPYYKESLEYDNI